MSFPLTLPRLVVDDPPALAKAVLADAEACGSTVVEGLLPHQWLSQLVDDGTLPRNLALGLVAVMVQSGQPTAVAEGARLAGILRDEPLARLLDLALQGLDAGLLLHADPTGIHSSVEDAVLEAWLAVAPLHEDEVRARALTKLRFAGLPELEFRVLAQHGNALELTTWLPAVAAEGLPASAPEVLAALSEERRSQVQAVLGA